MRESRFNQPPLRVGMISLGCAKNLVDAEVMLGSLVQAGVEITNDAASADALIVNTCSFIDAAQEESIDSILESAALRETRKPHQALIVSGCLSQRFRNELPKLMPEVDAFMGIDQVGQVATIVREAMQHRAVKMQRDEGVERDSRGAKQRVMRKLAEQAFDHPEEEDARPQANSGDTTRIATGPAVSDPPIVHVTARPTYVPDFATPRFRLTPRHFAYVKIAEGCNHPCSFCTIPQMRGSHRSRPQQDVLEEVRRLVAEGVREINLISQDSTYYGLDLRPARTGSIAAPERFRAAAQSLPPGATTLCTLLRALNDLPGDFWIRLLYTHPAHWTDELIRTIAECPKVARYVDMPLQHIHEVMLERMRRETSRDYIEDLIGRIRAGIPGVAIRTTFIVGFPGETEACFESLLEFIRKTKFERLGVFTYSREEGTRAGKMANQVPEAIKKRRRRQAMAEQLKVAREISGLFVGREMKVLVEKTATSSELRGAKIVSWEHGLVRGEASAIQLPAGEYFVARGEADAPDIDGRVYLRGKLPLGKFARVKIIGHTDYDLIAQPA